ncbi:MAG: T9SS type A sorting domain-containing protein [Bacteroidota bacterium]
MKKILFQVSFLMLLIVSSLVGTTTSSTTRAVDINGNIAGQKSATNGTNGSSWENDEAFSGNDGVVMYLTWDDTNLYVGWEGGDASQQHIVWIDIDPQVTPTNGTGSTSTFSYGGITATLPFTGNFFANIQSSYNEYRTNTTGTWSGGTSAELTVSNTNSNDIEVIIPWSKLGGKPSKIYILSYINDPSGGGSDGYVYGGSPTTVSSGDFDGGMSIGASNTWFAANVTSGIAPFSDQGGLLPVELTTFSVNTIGKNVHLQWSTATETNNAGFEIERQDQTSNAWHKIAFIEGHGTTSSPKSYSYVDSKVSAGKFLYRLKQIDRDGKFEYSNTVESNVGLTAEDFHLSQNYPNPFNPLTIIQFAVPLSEFVSLKVYNALGQEMKTLFNGIAEGNTLHKVEFDGSSLPSGVYFYALKTKERNDVKKLLLLK